ncbi:hypothetical protein [Streptomyces sp. NPDC007205]
MSMKRTNVHADPEDLAITKEAAKRRGMQSRRARTVPGPGAAPT